MNDPCTRFESNAASILNWITSQDPRSELRAVVTPHGRREGGVWFRIPRGLLTPSVRDLLQRYKGELLDRLEAAGKTVVVR